LGAGWDRAPGSASPVVWISAHSTYIMVRPYHGVYHARVMGMTPLTLLDGSDQGTLFPVNQYGQHPNCQKDHSLLYPTLRVDSSLILLETSYVFLQCVKEWSINSVSPLGHPRVSTGHLISCGSANSSPHPSGDRARSERLCFTQ
jgi:hypothetical protein